MPATEVTWSTVDRIGGSGARTSSASRTARRSHRGPGAFVDHTQLLAVLAEAADQDAANADAQQAEPWRTLPVSRTWRCRPIRTRAGGAKEGVRKPPVRRERCRPGRHILRGMCLRGDLSATSAPRGARRQRPPRCRFKSRNTLRMCGHAYRAACVPSRASGTHSAAAASSPATGVPVRQRPTK